MLYSALRLGSLLPELTRFEFGRTARSLTAGALMSLAAAYPAAAQQAGTPFTAKQCSDAVSIATVLVEKNKDSISRALVDSFVRFSRSNCDLNTDWELAGQADERIFGEFRVRLVALRSADLNRSPALARN
jgi:hypothetical protein